MKAVLDELMVQKSIFGQLEFTIGAGVVVENVNQLKDSFVTACYAIGQRLLVRNRSPD